MQISKYFSTEKDKNLITINCVDEEQINNLKHLCLNVDRIREKFGAVNVTSGLRKAKEKYSQHEDGLAMDFQIYNVDLFAVYKWIVNNMIFDQLIYEKDYKSNIWIHISIKQNGNRNETLIADVRKKNTLYARFYK